MRWTVIDGFYVMTLSSAGITKRFINFSDGIRWAYTTKLALQVANEWEMKA
jgi:hypothetical protein